MKQFCTVQIYNKKSQYAMNKKVDYNTNTVTDIKAKCLAQHKW